MDISFIFPLTEFNGVIDNHFNATITNIKPYVTGGANIILVHTDSELCSSVEAILTEKHGIKKDDITVVKSKSANYFDMINTAVYSCVSKYFTVIQCEDVMEEKWIDDVQYHIQNQKNERYDMYIPLTWNYKSKGGIALDDDFAGFTNEIALSSSFSDNLGEITFESLETFSEYTLTGAVIKTDDFITVGGFKPSLTPFVIREFLMRYTHNERRPYVIPKCGYRRYLNVENTYKNVYFGEHMDSNTYQKMKSVCDEEYKHKTCSYEG